MKGNFNNNNVPPTINDVDNDYKLENNTGVPKMLEHIEWRTSAMVRIRPSGGKILFGFMLKDKNGKDYDKNSRVLFSTNMFETYQIIKYLDTLLNTDTVTPYTLIHVPDGTNNKEVKKIFTIIPKRDEKMKLQSVYVSLIVNNKGSEIKYVISFADIGMLQYFVFKLKLMYYWLTTNTLIGFVENWI
jgi:hypothetical protein